MLFSDIKETALARCENKGKQLALDSELLIVIQNLVAAADWGWKRKKTTFDTVDATAEYTLPTDLDEIIAVHVSTGDQAPRRLTKLIDPHSFVDPAQIIQEAAPLNYYCKPGDDTKIALDPVPDGVYKVIITYDAIPVALEDDDTVPLVPERLHRLLVKGLEKTILRYTLGEESAKYQTVSEEYENDLVRATQ
jgi:hypothetical protein